MMMHSHLKTMATLAICLWLVACNQAQQPTAINAADSIALPTSLNNTISSGNLGMHTADSANLAGTTGRPVWNQLLIRNAELTLNAKSANVLVSKIYNWTQNLGGFVLNENQMRTGEEVHTDLTIKVPVQRFDEVLNQLCSGEVQVIEKNVSTTDVSTELVDTKTRLENQKLLRNRYQALLASAKSRSEIVELQQQVDQIQEQIDIALGRLNYLSHQTAFSTIHIAIHQTTSDTVGTGNGFGSKLFAALGTGAGILSGLFIFLATIWPFVLGILIIAFWYRWHKNKKQDVVNLKHG